MKIIAILTILILAVTACVPQDNIPVQQNSDKINLEIKDRKLIPESVTVTQGDDVTFSIKTDEAGEFHLAGYEIVEEMDHHGNTEVNFRADIAGRFNIELHPDTSHDDEHDHEDDSDDHEKSARESQEKEPHDKESDHSMHHELQEVIGEIPTLELVAHKDPKAGYNFELKTTNFKFSPLGASKEHVEGEGHAHIYIDDVKINRVYSNWYHVAKIEPGKHTVRATLNSNNHNDLAVNGKAIESSIELEVEGMEMKDSKDKDRDKEESHKHSESTAHEDILIGSLIVNP